MGDRLAGRVALVTGGGKGIGAHYVGRLCQEGAAVAAADVDGAAAEQQAARLRAEGAQALGVHVDVSEVSSVERMVQQTVERLGRLDILVNNAALYTAIFPKRPFWEIDPSDWDRVMAVNVKGAFLCARAALPHLKASGHGRIINIASSTVFNGSPGFLHYVSSKGALVAFTRALARECGPFGITVNVLAPGFTSSETARPLYTDEEVAVRAGGRSLKREQLPEDLLGALAFLASDDAAFMTGQTLVVDGGATFH